MNDDDFEPGSAEDETSDAPVPEEPDPDEHPELDPGNFPAEGDDGGVAESGKAAPC